MTREFKTKDSGERQEFEGGSRRDTQDGKPRFDLVGIEGLTRLAGLMERGAKKYGENNWRIGQPTSRYFASLLRHAYQWAMGDDSEDHLAAVCFNAFGIMHVEEKNLVQFKDHERYGYPDYENDPHASHCRCAKCEDERERKSIEYVYPTEQDFKELAEELKHKPLNTAIIKYPYYSNDGCKWLAPDLYVDKNGYEHNICHNCGKCVSCKSCSCNND